MRLAQKLIKDFRTAFVERFPRTNNSHADTLATLASAVDLKLKRLIEVEFLPKQSIETGWEFIYDIEANLSISWTDPIVSYLRDGIQTESVDAFRV